MQEIQLSIPLALPLTGLHRPGATSQAPYVLLLHGYAESGNSIFQELLPYLPSTWGILAFNAPFPLPRWRRSDNETTGSYEMRYAWYFFDPYTKRYYVDYMVPTLWLKSALIELKLSSQLTHIIGYSQGGYLAPFIAQEIASIKQVVVLGASYKHEFLAPKHKFRVDGIHGNHDDKVDYHNAKLAHAELMKKFNLPGEFHGLDQQKHALNTDFLIKLQAILRP